MAVVHRSSTSVSEASQTNIAFTKPTGAAAGDVVLITLYIETGSGTSITVPSGFTKTTDLNHSSITLRMVQCYRVLDGSEGASFQFTVSNNYCGGTCECVRSDAAGTLSLDVAGTAAQGSSTAPASSVTTLAANTLLLWSQINFDENANTPPTSFTERQDTPGTSVADKAQAAAGASGSLAGSYGPSSRWICCTHSIQETGGGGGGSTAARRLPVLGVG